MLEHVGAVRHEVGWLLVIFVLILIVLLLIRIVLTTVMLVAVIAWPILIAVVTVHSVFLKARVAPCSVAAPTYALRILVILEVTAVTQRDAKL